MKCNPLDYFEAEEESKSLLNLSTRLWETHVILEAALDKLTAAVKMCPDASNTSLLLRVSSPVKIADRRINNDQLALLKRATPQEDGPKPEAA